MSSLRKPFVKEGRDRFFYSEAVDEAESPRLRAQASHTTGPHHPPKACFQSTQLKVYLLQTDSGALFVCLSKVTLFSEHGGREKGREGKRDMCAHVHIRALTYIYSRDMAGFSGQN